MLAFHSIFGSAGFTITEINPIMPKTAQINQSFPKEIIEFITSANEVIQKPFRNSPWFKKTADITNAPDTKVFSWFKSIGPSVTKIKNIFSDLFKIVGKFFAWFLELVAKFIRLGLN